jgi:predicted dinucleotide-binding enzyme
MKVGVLGTGVVGRALGHGFIATGHQVMMGSRSADHPEAQAWVLKEGTAASNGTFADAARFGDIAVFATKGMENPAVVAAAGAANFAGKLVIDSTNPLDNSRGYPDIGIKGEDSGGEQLQRLLPDAKVVKAFNITTSSLMFRPQLPGGPPTMLIAGNDAGAKEMVSSILKDFGWPSIDLGPIRSARWLEAMCMAWVMAGLARGNWVQAFKLLHA